MIYLICVSVGASVGFVLGAAWVVMFEAPYPRGGVRLPDDVQ